jgi:uncharacterized membrane protein (DUF106 family)
MFLHGIVAAVGVKVQIGHFYWYFLCKNSLTLAMILIKILGLKIFLT